MSAEGANRGDGALRAVVDRDECFGFANCVATAPLVFRLDSSGFSVPADVDADPALLEAAMDGCPRGAISLIAVSADGDVRPR